MSFATRRIAVMGLVWAATLAALSHRAGAAQPAPVPPTLEIEVLDPNVDPLGNPAVIVHPTGPHSSIVEIPPVVLVHRYYYTGDRSFQGPMLPGGPSIVVVHHPRTGEQCYISVQMLPGAPRVHYTGGKIEYDYGRNGISIVFGLFGQPKVKYRNSIPMQRRAKNAVTDVAGGLGRMVHKSGVADFAKKSAEGATNFTVNAKNQICDLGERLIAPAVGLVNATPLGSLFQANPEEQAQRARDQAVRRAASQASQADAYLPTLR
ncbi:MAG: hypothetical protein ACYTG0_30130 [Planctomycetota bacterium]|jgi:hypothetical protein